jgi:ketosteroid isomerase-like protein
MSEESTTPDLVGLVRGAYEASNRRDFDAMMSVYAPDSCWDMTPMGLGNYKGLAMIRRFFEDWLGTFEEFEAEPDEILEMDGGVTLAVVLQSGRPIGSDGHVQLRYAQISVWVDGVALRTTNYNDIDEARAAAERLAEERGEAMSQENVEILRDGLTDLNAWNTSGAGDLRELLCKFLHQDVEWHDQRELPGASVHHGVGEVEKHLRAAREALDYETTELVEILDTSEAVLAHYHFSARGRVSGARVERETFYVYRFRDAKVAQVEIFGSRSEALEAVGPR